MNHCYDCKLLDNIKTFINIKMKENASQIKTKNEYYIYHLGNGMSQENTNKGTEWICHTRKHFFAGSNENSFLYALLDLGRVTSLSYLLKKFCTQHFRNPQACQHLLAFQRLCLGPNSVNVIS